MNDEDWRCPACGCGNGTIVIAGAEVRLRCHRCGADDVIRAAPGDRGCRLVLVRDPLVTGRKR